MKKKTIKSKKLPKSIAKSLAKEAEKILDNPKTEWILLDDKVKKKTKNI